MDFVEVDDPTWIPKMARLEDGQDKQWICDFAALRANRARNLGVEAATEFLARPRSTVVAAVDDGELVAYVVGDDDVDGRGGCRGRWVTIQPVDGYETHEILRGLLDVLADRYGWVWGRITNPLLQEVCDRIGDEQGPDPTVFTYKKM
jgi:hypothetical protein